MSYRSDNEQLAKTAWQEGQTVTGIARERGVSRKTIQRWMKDWTPEELDRGEVSDPATNPRIWPGWSVEDLTDLPGFDRTTWELNIASINMATNDGNRLTPWFFRRLVEFGRKNPDYPDGQLDWAIAVAGLPPIGEWLGDDGGCAELANAIEAQKPWEWRRFTLDTARVAGKARRAYQKAQQELSEGIHERIRIVSAQQSELKPDNWLTPGLLIAAFHERIPVFDRVPRGSHFRRFTLGAIVRGILVKELNHVA